MEPLVSVIMSTLNTNEQYLMEAINSILNQTYKNIEILIVVDGGNDDKIIEKINDNRIKIIKHDEPKGLANSLNEIIRLSKGKYVARMDSDDISMPTRIETQVEYMEKNQDIDMTGTYYKEFGESEKKVCEKFIRPDEIKAKLFYTNMISHPSVMFRKQFLTNNDIKYDKEYIYSQDYELWTRINKMGKISIIPKIELNYRIHKSQISSSKFQKQSELYYNILKRNLKELNMSQEDLKYLLMLNAREKNINMHELNNFIKRAIDNNNKMNIYDVKVFNIVLKTAFIKIMIKNKKILNKYFLQNLKYIYYI